MRITVKYLKGSNIKEAVQLLEKHNVPFDVEDYISCFDSPHVGLAAWRGKTLVGLLVMKAANKKGTSRLRAVVIHDDYRRRGIASRLVIEAVKRCPLPIRKVIADVPDDLLEAHLWLKSLGFVATHVSSGRDVYRFVLVRKAT